jgi:chromatin structure-remodeling complex subunit RSC1/2
VFFIYVAKLFDRDPTTNEVLWFAAPPMNMSRARGPRYSLEYLTFIATKKRKRREASTTDGIVVDGREELGEEGSVSVNAKRPRVGFPPTVTETMRELWKEMRADGFTI